jgi:hypothetical protein
MPTTATIRRKDRLTYAQAFDINGNTPPQAVELERSVLGALMLDQTALINAIETLHVDYFYRHVVCARDMERTARDNHRKRA